MQQQRRRHQPNDRGLVVSPETTEAVPETTESGLSGDGLEIGLLAPAPGPLSSLFQGQERGSAAAAAAVDVDDAGGVGAMAPR